MNSTSGLIDYLKASPPLPCHRQPCPNPAGRWLQGTRRARALAYRSRWALLRDPQRLGHHRLSTRRQALAEHGLRLVGAHTDSPCLRVKPQPELQRQGFWQLGVEVYGGALLAPWFDRDLSLAGRVTYSRDGRIESQLIDFRQPIASIPNLAIHLNREVNRGWAINAQNELPPILAQIASQKARTSAPCSPTSSAASTARSPMWCWTSN